MAKKKADEASALAHYRIYKVSRPNAPHVLKWIDREFEVIYINTAAQPNAKIVRLK